MIAFIKQYGKLIVLAAVMLLSLTLFYFVNKAGKYEHLYNVELSNRKAFESEADTLKSKSLFHQMTISQLTASKDSVDIALKEALKKLNIKPKNVISVGQVTSNIEKRDSIIIQHDTIFQNKVNIDTVIGDKWYKAELKLKYPSRIDMAVSMLSVKHIVVNNRKETVNPPKKCWLLRLFQKKHVVQEVVVNEENPHIESGSQRFISIIK
jgi:hypothetical protein